MINPELEHSSGSEAPRLPDLEGEHYLSCLSKLHQMLKPRTYLEVGTCDGSSLQQARCASIAVDPWFQLRGRVPAESMPVLCLFQMPSDQFFKSYDARSILGAPIDFAFLDGMHLFEYLLRDFMNTERVCHENSVVVLHDCVPLDIHMARRDWGNTQWSALSAHPNWWTGDVWKILLVLRAYRPELEVEIYDAPPTGLVVIRGLDPASTVLSDNYGQIIAEYQDRADEVELYSNIVPALQIRATGALVGPQSPLWGNRLIPTLLTQHPPRDFFREDSPLRQDLLELAASQDVVEPLRQALAKARDHEGVALLYQEAARLGWTLEPNADLAFCKPAVTSSVCRSSRHPDPRLDACGANGDPLAYDYGFHTDQETDPWWQVDLLEEYLVEEVAIVNRLHQPERFRTFRIETSCDGSLWTTRFTQSQPREVSSNLEWPLRVVFPDPSPARYVRIVLLGSGPLHLRRVQVFGWGSLVEGKRLIGRLLGKHPLRDFFRHGSELREALLAQAAAEDIVEPLRLALAAERDHRGVALLHQEAAVHGWSIRSHEDLAFCKPAVSSSVCGWSRFADPERDACGANGEPGHTFHTDQEVNPWWKVDLLEEYLIEEVAIVNRNIEPQRFSRFRIDTSSDGSTWTTRHQQTEPCTVSSDLERPWRLRLEQPLPARHVRIVLLGMGPLHLRKVQVFGSRQGNEAGA
jgi:hypothetical protein